MSIEIRGYPGLQPGENFRIIRLEPQRLAGPENRALRGRIMSDPEEAIAVLKPSPSQFQKEKVIVPEKEAGKRRGKIIEGLEVLVGSPSENVSTVALLQLSELKPQKVEEIASREVEGSAARLLDRNREVSPGCDEIELTNLAWLFRLGSRNADFANSTIAHAKAVASSVEFLARGQLRNEVPTDIIGGDYYRGGVVNWWNKAQVVHNIVRMTDPMSGESLYNQINPDFFKTLGLKYQMIEKGKLFERLSPDSSRFFGGLVPGMASAVTAEDLYLDRDHAQARIAATISQVSYEEFEKLGVSAQRMQAWGEKLESYAQSMQVLKDPKKFLLLADFQIAVEQIVKAGQRRKIEVDLQGRRN